jgi:oxygen-independent coproporphyrinogen-3 oxidase
VGAGVSAVAAVALEGSATGTARAVLATWPELIDAGRGLDGDDILRRSIIQALMCRFALSVEAIEQVHGINFAEYFAAEMPAIREFQQQGLLTFDGDFLMVEPKGRFLIRNIAMAFDRHLRERQTKARYSRTI